MSPILPHTKKPRTFAELRTLTGLDHEDLNAEIRRQRKDGALREVPPDGVNDRAIRYVNAGVIVRRVAPPPPRICELATLPPSVKRSHDPAKGLPKWRQGEVDRERILARLESHGAATIDELGDALGLESRRLAHLLKMLAKAGKAGVVAKRGREVVFALLVPR